MDEFRSIEALFRPLAAGAPEALGLTDDAAVLPSRPGFDLIVTKDAMVEGVHFLPGDPADLVARKLLRVNLSDLAAKAAEPYGYLLATAWPKAWDETRRTLFAAGLGEDQTRYALKLFGGDTVSTPGPLTLSVTMFGWSPEGGMIKRSGARIGDRIFVSGTIGDGYLGLAAILGKLDGGEAAWGRVSDRYRLPEPRTSLTTCLRRFATSAADVSDGLLADAAHLGEASGLGVRIELERLPLSPEAQRWLESQSDRCAALTALAAGGDDYEIVFTAADGDAAGVASAAETAGVSVTDIGRITGDQGCAATFRGEALSLSRLGWSHS